MFTQLFCKSLSLLTIALLLVSGCDSARQSYQKIKLQFNAPPSELAPTDVISEKHHFQVKTLLNDLYLPWGMAFLPDQTLLITEKPGNLYRYDLSSGKKYPISGVPETKVWGQGGLMDVLPHPNFTENQWVYFSYTGLIENGLAATRVIRARLQDNRLQNIEVLFTAQPPLKSGAHFGSALLIDHNGYLYITSGERHARPLVQELSNHIGKIIRLHDDGRIPEDNPFIAEANALPEIYSYGHRNPQGITIEPRSGKLLAVEHGPRGGDEINIIESGKNYGWPVITHGKEYVGGKIGEGTSKQGMEQPLYYYVPSIAPSNIIVYQGDAFPKWKNNIFVGALKLSHINRLELNDGLITHEERLIDNLNIRVKSIEEGPDGYIYILSDAGELLQIKPAD